MSIPFDPSTAKKQVSETISSLKLYFTKNLDRLLLIVILLVLVLPYLVIGFQKGSSWIEKQKKIQISRSRAIDEEKKQVALRLKIQKTLDEYQLTTVEVSGNIHPKIIGYLEARRDVLRDNVDCINPIDQYEKECTPTTPSINKNGRLQPVNLCGLNPSNTLVNRIELCNIVKDKSVLQKFLSELPQIVRLLSEQNIKDNPDLSIFFQRLKMSLSSYHVRQNNIQTLEKIKRVNLSN